MNKGVALATGEYVVFLHADDYFKDESSLEKAVEFLDETTDILACSIHFGKQLKLCEPREFNFWFNFKGIPHQGVLCRRALINKFNGFDRQFLICMDYDLLLCAYHSRARLAKAPVVLAVMRDTGISSQQGWMSLRRRFDEERRVHEKHCMSFYMSMLYRLYWFLYLPYRRVSHVMKDNKRQK